MSTMIPAPPRPAPGEARPYQFPRFERSSLPNGMGVIIAPVPKLPVVTALLVIRAGAMQDPTGEAGVAQLTAQALLEGSAMHDGDALIAILEGLGSSLEATADWDASTVKLTVLADRLEPALRLLGEVVRSPAFPERDVQRLRDERLAELLQLRAEPRGLADEMFARFIYPADHRYSLPDGGTPESVATLTTAQLRRFHATHFSPANATLVLAGDVDGARGTALAKAIFGDWNAASAGTSIRAPEVRAQSRSVHIVAKEEAPQSELRVGHPSVPRQHPDYFPLTVMNAVLGGLFNSRINLNLREEHAYTYGAFSSIEWRRGPSPFEVSSAVRSDVTADALKEVLSEIEEIRAKDIGDEELSLATSYLDGVFPIRYETTAAIAAALAAMVVHELPPNYFDEYRQNIRAVTCADVLRVAREHLRPDALQIVVVGDPEATRPPLEAAFGAVTLHDAEGRALG